MVLLKLEGSKEIDWLRGVGYYVVHQIRSSASSSILLSLKVCPKEEKDKMASRDLPPVLVPLSQTAAFVQIAAAKYIAYIWTQ